MKLAGALIATGVVLVAAFILLPKLLLNVSSGSSNNANLPVGESRAALATGTAAPGAATRRFESFIQLQSEAGFTPLTPASLPGDYQPWEEYVKSDGSGKVAVLSYLKADGLYIQIYERPQNGNDPSGRAFFRGGFQPGNGSGRAGGQSGRPANSPLVTVGDVQGLYTVGAYGPGSRQLSDAIAPAPRNSQPHRVLLIRNNLEIIVEADLTDVPRDELIQIAAGLR